MWGVFSITDPQNKEKEWDFILHHSKFPLEYAKGLVQSLLKGSEVDQYIVQNLTWSGVYLRNTLSNDLLRKVLTLVPLTATGPEVYVATMTTIISNSYYSLVDTLKHMKNLKLLHQYRFPLEYVKYHVESLLKGSEVYQYIVQNLTWSGVYL